MGMRCNRGGGAAVRQREAVAVRQQEAAARQEAAGAAVDGGRGVEMMMMLMADEDQQLSLTVAQVVRRLKGSRLHSQIERQAKDCLHLPEIKLASLKGDVRHFLKTSASPPSATSPPPQKHRKEPLVYMRNAQANWERRVLKSLSSMSTELGVPLARKRPAAEQKELANKWNEMSTEEPDLSQFRPVYAPKDFLEVSTRTHWGLIQVPLSVRDVGQMREMYAELGLTTGQLGIDDQANLHPDLFESVHVRVGKKGKKTPACDCFAVERLVFLKIFDRLYSRELYRYILKIYG
ncbi:hypothetical protein CRUP_036182 [Coryphaenoides rupestris]|nr:hypothetical protein CRUP_036182 [Coryphaenoides rupestris]